MYCTCCIESNVHANDNVGLLFLYSTISPDTKLPQSFGLLCSADAGCKLICYQQKKEKEKKKSHCQKQINCSELK